MTFEEAERLRPTEKVDHRDEVGRYLLAMIRKKEGTRLLVHYEGWDNKWDIWSDYSKELNRFAVAESISHKPNTRLQQLQVGSYVDINPILRHPGWKTGQIRRMDKHSGQVQVLYKESTQEFLCWTHLNNPQEIAPFMTKTKRSSQKSNPCLFNANNNNDTAITNKNNNRNNVNNDNQNGKIPNANLKSANTTQHNVTTHEIKHNKINSSSHVKRVVAPIKINGQLLFVSDNRTVVFDYKMLSFSFNPETPLFCGPLWIESKL
ncbi:HECT-domain (ubiquitin-transferase) [Reticulomyxa filosa]|uniref:HECT-domain (Ubiquitin-transferase) n=1 Tax=Reticulomyxa filosa TaxID=46433 RepID=X6P8E7_RETFI|nr:HECT-domain (ubiquitin-transferase) [Reticulomyxa filosa]|eukprot:ETO34368.1 HECT-domain (ubiquitin-transferase) [Reticulomyxa filosa]